MLVPRYGVSGTFLCPLTEDSWKYFLKWFNDGNILTQMGDHELKPFTEQNAKQYVQAHLIDSWLICTADRDTQFLPIGFCGAFIKARHNFAIVRIAIGEMGFLGQGHARRAMAMLQDWLFKEMDMYAIHLTVDSRNVRAIELYRRIGFNHCGTYRDSRRHLDGTRSDEYCMELMRSKLSEE